MAKLTAGVLVRDEATGDPRFLAAGEELPEEFADQVGEHILENDSKRRTRS